MNYKMAIRTAPGKAGHFIVELSNGENSIFRGFTPIEDQEKAASFNASVPGYVSDDKDEANATGTLRSQDIPLSKEQFDKAKEYIDKTTANPGNYDLTSRNCVDFANGALKAAGIDKNVGEVMTPEQDRQMSGAALYRNAKYPDPNRPLTFPEDGMYPGGTNPHAGPAKTSDASDSLENAEQPKVTLHETNFGTVLSTTNVAALETTDSPAQTSDILEAASVPQTGGLANEAVETQAAADQAKDEDAKEQTANIDSRIASMREMAAQPIDHPGKSALLKPVGVWTESEMKDVLNSAQGDFTGWRSGDPLKARMYETVQDWHTNVYGDGPQVLDGGKPVEPKPVREVSDLPVPHLTKEGEDLWKASARMGDKIGTIAETDGYEQSVKALQRGINMLNDSAGQPERSPAWGDYTPQEALKVDGEYGPKTDFALKDTLARHGMPKAEDALALGRFGTFADQVRQTGKAEGLDQAARDIFGPLYGGSEAPNGVLQETLNKVGSESVDGWQPLKVDDWIGPKTTQAFAQVMENVDSEDFTRSFGSGLGLV